MGNLTVMHILKYGIAKFQCVARRAINQNLDRKGVTLWSILKILLDIFSKMLLRTKYLLLEEASFLIGSPCLKKLVGSQLILKKLKSQMNTAMQLKLAINQRLINMLSKMTQFQLLPFSDLVDFVSLLSFMVSIQKLKQMY